LYMNIGKHRKYARISSVLSKSNRLFLTTFNDDPMGVVVMIDKKTLTEKEILKSEDGMYYFDSDSILFLLTKDDCKKDSFKLYGQCFKKKAINFDVDKMVGLK